VTGSLGVQNTYRLRGYSVSGGHPVGTLDLYYDDPSGIYVNLSGIGELGHGATPEALGYIANLGYARRIGPQLSIDGGVAHGSCRSIPAFDMLGALDRWVEGGAAPEAIRAQARRAPDVPWPGRTRDLCAFPKVARYKGSGSLEEAANFECR